MKFFSLSFIKIYASYVGVLLNNNIKNLVASCDKSLYRYSNLYRTNVMFCLVSVSLDPRNGDIPDNKVYAITPSDHISEYGYAGSSHKISGAANFKELVNKSDFRSPIDGIRYKIVYLWTPTRCLPLQLLLAYWLSAHIQSRLVWLEWSAQKPSLCYPVANPNGHILASVNIAIRLIPMIWNVWIMNQV